ncbi:MAG TPA: anti-sigma factor [Bryobacteraceae bacterium]|nr:anti-sigma factor [Bryobacteraceae bacterium]
MSCDDAKALLNAWMDGEIDSIRRVALGAHVKTCSSCAVDLEELENVRDTIRGSIQYHRAPAGLRDQVRLALRGAEYLDHCSARSTGWRVWGGVAAAIALMALASAPFLLNARNQRQLVAEELLSAHERALLGRGVDVISSDQHTVKPWFNGKLPFSPPVTDLGAQGFPLEGGRLDYAGGQPVAALVYSRRLHRIDVFVRTAAGQKQPPSNFERNGYHEISWTRNNFLFTAVSDLNTKDLAQFVGLLQTR